VKAARRLVEADLAGTGDGFERGVAIGIDREGRIASVGAAPERPAPPAG